MPEKANPTLTGFKSEFTDWCRLLPRHTEPFVPVFVCFVVPPWCGF